MVNELPEGFKIDEPVASSDEVASVGAPPEGFQLDEEKHGSLGQSTLAGVEGLAKGALGPLATLGEKGLTKIGVPGLSPEEQEGRALANPYIHGGAEVVGLAGPALLSAGTSAAARLGLELPEAAGLAMKAASKLSPQAAVIEHLGNAAKYVSGFEEGTTLSKIAASGVKTGAEMAALQASDEASKLINEDPNQSIGTAAINIGLSGLAGGVGGAVLGSVSPLWKSSMEKMGAPKLIDDAKAQYGFRKSVPAGDVPAAVTGELTTRMNEVDKLVDQMSNLKSDSLGRAMPEVNPVNTKKIDSQIQEISSRMTRDIEKAGDNAYLKSSVPKLQQDFQDFLEVVTKPEATFQEKFNAIDDLKRAQQSKSKYNLTAEDSALGAFTKNIARDLRLSLEDQGVWGAAGKVQAEVNSAIKASIDAEKDAAGKFTSKMLGDRVADPTKINTLINQSAKGKAGLKTDIMSNYLKSTENLADKINQIHLDAGLEAPIRLSPTPATNNVLGTKASAGTTLGNWLYDKGLASVVGHLGGEAIGGGLGALVGHPIFGALVGERLLSPAITSIAKPLMENATRSEAFKASLEYAMTVLKGEKVLSNAAKNIFRPGSEVLAKDLLPTKDSRDKLEKSVEHASNFDNAVKIGGGVNHYMPEHGAAAAQTVTRGIQYLKSLKPTQPQMNPLDKPAPIDKMKQQLYDRALDIAQQPLIVLKHVKEGTLQAGDVKAIAAIYPNLLSKIVNKAYDEMAKTMQEGKSIPYKQRLSLSLLMGKPLDSTMTQMGMDSIMKANTQKGSPQQGASGQPKKVSQSTANSMQKTNKMYATPAQARAASRLAG